MIAPNSKYWRIETEVSKKIPFMNIGCDDAGIYPSALFVAEDIRNSDTSISSKLLISRQNILITLTGNAC
jgi:hypothetical protein